MNESTKFSRVQGERCPRPLLTSTTVGQGSDKSIEKGYGETWVTTGMNHGEHGARSHSAVITLEQGRVSHAQYDTCDTYGRRIRKKYGHYNA